MENLISIGLNSVFVGNILLSYFLGMCSFLAVSRNLQTAAGLGVAVTFVVALTTPVNWLIYRLLLAPGALAWAGLPNLNLSFLKLILFIAQIAAIVQIIEMIIDRYSPALYTALGVYLPLITVNCAILGASLFMVERNYSFAETVVYGAGSGTEWCLAIIAMAAIQKKLRYAKVPIGLQGFGISMIVTGLIAIGFMMVACQLKVKEDMRIRIPDEIFNIKKYKAMVVSNENVATFIKELILKLDPGQRLDFKSGAYVQIDIPPYQTSFNEFSIPETYKAMWDRYKLWSLVAKAEEPVYRAYSMANTPAEELLRFTIRIATPPPGVGEEVPPGVGSSYAFRLKPGDPVVLSGPFGDFFVKDTRREMCFLGGGAGMAPMRSHIFDQLLRVQTGRRITFWYGARSKTEMIYDEEFRELARRFPNFTYTVALSEPLPEDQWDGPVGFIHQVAHDLYLGKHEDPAEIEYYLCGPPMMLRAVEKTLDSLGVDPEMIAYDEFD